MKRQAFIKQFFPLARVAGERFGLNPVVILAQAALESGWGQSTLSREYNNFFGICAYGRANEFWSGMGVELGRHGLTFRRYGEPGLSFLDFARLITSTYKQVAAVSFHPEAYAQEIAYSRYISEKNGDNREAYRRNIVLLCKTIVSLVNNE